MWKLLFVVALAAFVGANEEDAHAEVKSGYNEQDGHGHFKYGYDITNGVEAKAEGDVNAIRGEYFLVNEHGEKVKVTYTADSTGFHPDSSLLPTAPPVPAAVQKAVDYNLAHPQKEGGDKGHH